MNEPIFDASRLAEEANAITDGSPRRVVLASPELGNSRSMAVGYSILPPGVEAPPHVHVAEEFAVVVAGRGRLRVGSTECEVSPGVVMHAPSNVEHSAHAAPDSPLVVMWTYAPPGSERRWLEEGGGGRVASDPYFVVDGLDHVECVAVAPDGRVWSGGEGGQIYVFDGTTAVVHADVGAPALGMAFSADGDCFVCTRDGRIVVVRPDGSTEVFASEAGGRPLHTPNMLAFAPDGTLFVTDSRTFGVDDGELLAFDGQGAGRVVQTGLRYPNGVAVDVPRERLYVVSTETDSLLALDLSRLEAAPEYVAAPGKLLPMPDGVALDERGNIYVTSYGANAIERISADGAISTIARDDRGIFMNRVTNCAFGGPERTRLYYANFGGTSIGAVDLDVPGVILPVKR